MRQIAGNLTIILALAWGCHLFAASSAIAASAQVGLKAVITGIIDPGFLPEDIYLGDTLSGYYSYDLANPDLDPSSHRGQYEYTGGPTTLVVYADGGWVFRSDASNKLVLFTVGDSLVLPNGNGPADTQRFRSVFNTGASQQAGWSLQMGFMQLDLVDSSLTANETDDLPTLPPDLADWTNRRQLLITGYQADWVIYADIIWMSASLPTGVPNTAPRFDGWLGSAVPNPFNPSTVISFRLNQPGFVRMTVHDVAGRLIRTLLTEDIPEGDHSVRWDGRDDRGAHVASGTYLYRLEANGRSIARKVTLLK